VDSSQLTPLDRRYDAQVRAVWTSVLASMVARWSGLRSWRSDDVQTFQRSALPVLLAGQRQVASLTTTYLERLYRDIAGESSRVLLDFDRVTGPALRGIPLETEYERPFTQVWTALSNGEPFDVALQRGEARLSSLVKTDLQLARTHTAREVTDQQPGVQYTIRVPIGEYNCALCLVAATQRYRKKDLLPIHPGCDCIVKTVKADFDPGQVIDEQRLEAIHAAIEAAGMASSRAGDVQGTRANGSVIRGYQDLIISHLHGEIGPVLGIRGQTFTGPTDIPT
jgi:hypothetical protein